MGERLANQPTTFVSLPRLLAGGGAPFWHAALEGDDVLQEVATAPDRSLAVVGGAVLEAEMRSLLERHSADSAAADKLVGAGGALGAFQAQVEVDCLMGLIGPDVRSDLKKIATIRNTFAHQARGLSFDQSPIKEHCRDLRAPDRYVRYRSGDAIAAILLRTIQSGRVIQIGLDISGPSDPRQAARWRFEATVQLLAFLLKSTSLARPAATTPAASWERPT